MATITLLAVGLIGLLFAAIVGGGVASRAPGLPPGPPERVNLRLQRPASGDATIHPEFLDTLVVPGGLRKGDPWRTLEESHRAYLTLVFERAEAAAAASLSRKLASFMAELRRLGLGE